MDMKINFLPAKTWNWLRMNETEVKQVKADRQALEKEEIPETFAVEASTLEPIKTGMGPDMDKLAEQSGFAAKAYRMPAGIKEAAALRLGFVCKDQTASLDLIDLIAEENSEMTVVMDYASDADAEGLCSVRTRAKVGKGALLRLVQIDCLGKGFRVLNDVGSICEDQGRIEMVHIFLGGGKIYQGCQTELLGKESSLQSDIGYLLQDDQRLDMNYVALHEGKRTNSEINASGVLKDASSKLFRGTIDFQHGSAESVGAEKEDVLLMGDDVVNQTIPLILCAEEDVKGSHGASIGQLDEETLFYMQARGISEEQAYALMADARIEAVCQKIPDETAQKLVKAYLGGDEADECEKNS